MSYLRSVIADVRARRGVAASQAPLVLPAEGRAAPAAPERNDLADGPIASQAGNAPADMDTTALTPTDTESPRRAAKAAEVLPPTPPAEPLNPATETLREPVAQGAGESHRERAAEVPVNPSAQAVLSAASDHPTPQLPVPDRIDAIQPDLESSPLPARSSPPGPVTSSRLNTEQAPAPPEHGRPASAAQASCSPESVMASPTRPQVSAAVSQDMASFREPSRAAAPVVDHSDRHVREHRDAAQPPAVAPPPAVSPRPPARGDQGAEAEASAPLQGTQSGEAGRPPQAVVSAASAPLEAEPKQVADASHAASAEAAETSAPTAAGVVEDARPTAPAIPFSREVTVSAAPPGRGVLSTPATRDAGVQIGQVDVFIEAQPQRPSKAAAAQPVHDAASRHYLRRL